MVMKERFFQYDSYLYRGGICMINVFVSKGGEMYVHHFMCLPHLVALLHARVELPSKRENIELPSQRSYCLRGHDALQSYLCSWLLKQLNSNNENR